MLSSQGDGSLRVNMIAAQCLGQLIAPFTIEGSCNRSVARDLAGNLPHSCAETGAGSGHG